MFVSSLRDCWQLLLPTACCRLCGASSGQPLCAPCLRTHFDRTRARCRRCALALPARGVCGDCLRRRSPPFGPCLALGDYAPPLDKLLHALKFGDEPGLGRWFGRELGRRWRDGGWPLPQLLLPVPLSARRLVERGYNQSREIARGMQRELGTALRCDLLLRSRDSPAQSGLPLRQRRANVAGAFSAAAGVGGLRVLLVDDVMTSGNTAAAAALALRRSGARQVMLAVVLRTPAPD